MPKVVSQRQLEANRNNAKKASGPRKRRRNPAASLDPFEHTLMARNTILSSPLSNESDDDLEQLLSHLFRQLRPTDLIEQTLVERIAVCYWRLSRAQSFEASLFRTSLEAADNSPDRQESLRNDACSLHDGINLGRRIMSLHNNRDQLTPDERAELDEACAEFMQHWPYLVEDPTVEPTPENLCVTLPGRLRAMEREAEQYANAFNEAPLDEQARLASRCLTKVDKGSGRLPAVIRYEELLDRQLHRAYAELRRLRASKPPRPEPRRSRRAEEPLSPAVHGGRKVP